MSRYKVILSSGSIPWLGLKEAFSYLLKTGYDGLEIVPTRKMTREIEDAVKFFGPDRWINHFTNINLIKGIHQNWRLDIGLDKEYRINLLLGIFFTIIRILLFPKPDKSRKIIKLVSEKLNLPVTVHDISNEWTNCDNEFSGGIFLEMIGEKGRSPEEIKSWLVNRKHKIVVDTRDDQSLLWARNYGLSDWKTFWEWIGIGNIGGIQLTLIGIDGLDKILRHQLSSAEEQFLWLNKQKWNGVVTVEVNPLILLLTTRGKIKQGLQTIATFVRQTLGEGNSWSN